MALEAKITQNYNNGYVQMQTKAPGAAERYYEVPNNAVKQFSKELKEQTKKMNRTSNIAYFLAIFTGCFGASFFTKKVESGALRFLTQVLAGVGLAVLTSIGVNEYSKATEDKLLKKYNVKEQHYVV